jgi:hypothetical protein
MPAVRWGDWKEVKRAEKKMDYYYLRGSRQHRNRQGLVKSRSCGRRRTRAHPGHCQIGLRVRFVGQLRPDISSIHMSGKILELIEIARN